MAEERRVGPQGKPVTIYLGLENLELIDRVGAAFKISRSVVIDGILASKRDELETALALKASELESAVR